MSELPPIATPDEVAAYLRTSVETLKSWRYHGRGPRYTKSGKNVLYRRRDVETYLDQNTHETTGAAR
jgi:excisionase family DNA binding protein